MPYFAASAFIPPLLPQWNLSVLVARAGCGIFCKYDPATALYRERVGADVRSHQLLTKVTACCIFWESYYGHSSQPEGKGTELSYTFAKITF